MWSPKDGWAPLCDFLESPAPDVPLPHVNDAKQFGDRIVDAADGRVEPMAGGRNAGWCQPVSLAEAGSKSSAAGAAASPGAGPTPVLLPGPPRRGRARATVDVRQRWLLAVCCVGQFMVILDLSIVNVALPSIQSSLGFSTTQLAVGGRRLRDILRRLLDARRAGG